MDGYWVCEIWQSAYDYLRTWLLYVGSYKRPGRYKRETSFRYSHCIPNNPGTIMLRLLLITMVLALAIALCSCGVRDNSIDVKSSYMMNRTFRPTLPRCYYGNKPMGAPFTSADIEALKVLVSVTVDQSVETAYHTTTRTIAIEPRMPRSILLHEVCHVGQVDSGINDYWSREAGAMIVEIACLMQEGWSDSRIRDLSANNSQTPDSVFNWIRSNGPALTGSPSDIMIVYNWHCVTPFTAKGIARVVPGPQYSTGLYP